MNDIQAATLIQKVFRGKQVRNTPQIIALKRQGGECPITQNRLTMYNSTTTPCGHAFESTTLMQWLQVSQNGSCPTCRRAIVDHTHNQAAPPLPPITPEQNEVIAALRAQGTNLISRRAISAATQNGLGQRSQQQVLSILSQPELANVSQYLPQTAADLLQDL